MRVFRNKKGFTLVELMVVILIIGILVAIAVPIFNNARASAQRRTCQANLRTMDGAIQTWKADNPADTDAYPSTIDGVAQDLVGGYIKAMPVCPTDNSSYTVPSGGGSVPPVIECIHKAALGHSY